MKNVRNEIDEYLTLWDQAQKTFPKAKKAQPKDSSFFGLQNHDVKEISENEEESWRDIYYRSLEIDPDELRDENLLSEEDIDQQCLAGMMSLREAKEAKKKVAEAKSKKKAKKSSPPPPPSKKKKTDPRKPKNGETPPDWDDEDDGFGKDLADGPGEDVDFTPNPVHFASIGADSDLRVTPNFTDGKELRKLAKLKSLLYDLETELLGNDVRGRDTEPVRVKMMAVRRQCESLSQSLIPDPRRDVS